MNLSGPSSSWGCARRYRRGDCCLLDWKDVDLANQFITVKTSKTGQTVSIPIFPMLQDELEKQKKKPTPHPTLLPGRGGEGGSATGRRITTSGGLCVSGTGADVFGKSRWDHLAGEKDSGGGTQAETGGRRSEGRGAPRGIGCGSAEARQKAFIAKLPEGEKQSRMAAVFKLYMDRGNIMAVMAAAKVSKGSVSGYLNEIESAIGCRIMRGSSHANQRRRQRQRRHRGCRCCVSGAEKPGLQRAGVRDFHSFRVTPCNAGADSRCAAGTGAKGHRSQNHRHCTGEHYFQPGREAFRLALNAAMPKLLMSGSVPDGPISKTVASAAGD